MAPSDDENTLDEWRQWNDPVIAQFRENAGEIASGYYEGVPLILLHTVGAKSGQERVHPLTCDVDGDRLFVVASRGGDDRNPDWFHNLVAHPKVIVEMGGDRFRMVATVADEPERTRLFEKRASWRPVFREYQAQTDRVIPVVIFTHDPESDDR